jgi:hypothetical protein
MLLDVICLPTKERWIVFKRHHNNNEQGGHDLLPIQIKRIKSRRQLTSVSLTPSIIQQIEGIAELDDMPFG